MVKNWTRIEMLLALYERTIMTIRCAKQADQEGNAGELAGKTLEANRFILALHAGLDTENCEIAQNIANLLNFVMLRLGQRKFDEAARFLEELQASFERIREEAEELEKKGEIPPLNSHQAINTIV